MYRARNRSQRHRDKIQPNYSAGYPIDMALLSSYPYSQYVERASFSSCGTSSSIAPFLSTEHDTAAILVENCSYPILGATRY